MPTISRFYGILIQMYFSDHNPPHVHVVYGESKAAIEIHSLTILAGDLPPRAVGLVAEWMRLHEKELLENWKRARNRQPLQEIRPLT